MRYNHFDMLPKMAFRPIGKRMTLEGPGSDGKGGGGKTTSQTQIDPTIQKFRDFGLSEAQRLYQSANPQYYPGQTFISPSEQTQAALQAQQTRAMQGNPLLPAAQQNLMNLQSATNIANPLFANAYGNAQTSPQLSQNVYSNLASGQMTNAATPMNQFSASGGYLGSNPYFSQALQGAGAAATQQYFDAINQAQSGASQAGRFGSGTQENLFNRAGTSLANTLANKAGELAYNQYGMERGLQEAAMGRLAGTSAQDIANQLTGAQQLSNVGQQTFNNQLAAAQGLAGTSAADLSRQLAAGQAAPALAQADYYDIDRLRNVGQTAEDYQEAALKSDIARFDFEQNLPYQKLSQYLSSVYGAPAGQMQTSQQSSDGKIVCSMMNEFYGTTPFRNRVWLLQSQRMPNAKTVEKGYHTLFLPLVAFAKKDGFFNKVVRSILEHIARHRTADIYKEMRNGKRDTLGRIYRAVLEPLCYVVGKVKGA
jgi:hypothetical protein